MLFRRTTALFAVIVALFALLLGQLYTLSVDNGVAMRASALRQQSYRMVVAEKRGTIYDCSGLPLTYDGEVQIALIDPMQFGDKQGLVHMLAAVSPAGTQEVEKAVSSGKPFTLELSGTLSEQKGIRLLEVSERVTADSLAPHVIGDVNSEGSGVTGIEKAFDEWLTAGGGRITATAYLDAARRTIPGLGISVSSENYGSPQGVRLTLDAGIQRIAEEAADEYIDRGVVVVSEVATGKIRALVSRPDFNPTKTSAYLESDRGELLNRALQPYNLGSIFKLVVSAAAIERYGQLPDGTFTCTGGINVAGRQVGCHLATGHGEMGIVEAFMESCNSYFIHLSQSVGYESIREMAVRFGLSDTIELAAQIKTAGTTLPKDTKSAPPLLLANTAIGQGEMLITPLHVAAMINTVAGGGVLNTPTLVEGLVNDDGSMQEQPASVGRRVISETTAKQICEMMVRTVEGGTGTTAAPQFGGAGGKTASAETGWIEDGEAVVHGWFAGFFPAENPRYSIVVLAENGKSGARAASPAFKRIADEMRLMGYLR